MKKRLLLVLCAMSWLAGSSQIICGQKPELISQTGHNPTLITEIVFSPDGKTLASASMDKSVRLWSVQTGRELRTFVHSSSFWSVAFSHDGKMLAAGAERDVKIWDAESGNELRNLVIDDIIAGPVAFSFDDKILAVGSGSKHTIELWDIESGKRLRKLEAHSNFIDRLEFTPDGKYLTSGSSDKTGKVWEVASGALVQTLPDYVPHLAFSPDLKLVSASKDDQIKIFDVVKGDELASITVPRPGGLANFISSLAFSPDGKVLASGETLGTIRLWDFRKEKELLTFTGRSFYFKGVTFNSDGSVAAFGDLHGSIKLFDIERGELLPAIQENSFIMDMVFSPDGQTLATTTLGSTIKLWDVRTGNRQKAFAFLSKRFLGEDVPDPVGNLNALSQTKAGGVTAIAFSPDGKLIVGGGRDNTLKIGDIKTGRSLGIFFLGAEPKSVALSPDNKMVVGASEKLIKIWRVLDGRLLSTLPRNCSSKANLACPTNVRFSSDGKTIAGFLDINTLRIWNAQTGRIIKTLPRNSEEAKTEVRSLSPDLYERLYKVSVTNKFSAVKSEAKAQGLDRLSFYDKDTGKEIASLTIYGETDWLVTTPEGFFDGTPNAWKQLIWRFNNNTFDYSAVELYFNDFFQPNLLQDVMAGKAPKPLVGRELEKIDRRQPKVEIISTHGQAEPRLSEPSNTKTSGNRAMTKVVIEVADNIDEKKQSNHASSSGAQDLRLFRNGSLVKVWRGDVFKLGKQDNCEQMVAPKANEPRRVRCQAEIPIVAGENNFTAYAFNLENVKSNDSEMSVNGASTLKRKGTLYILAIGINEYANTQFNLRYAVADARDFAEELKRQQAKLNTFEQVEIIHLFDRDATKERILQALTQLRGRTQPEDAVTIYFSGHGTAQEKRFYLIPHDLGYQGSRDGLDKAGINLILTQSISDRDLETALETLDGGQFLLVIDACNSGQALDSEGKQGGPMNSKGLAQLAYEKGMYILTAAQSYEKAWENTTLGHGYLTYALVNEGVRRGLADNEPKDGRVLLREWLNYATGRVPRMQAEGLGKELRRKPQEERQNSSSSQPTSTETQTPRVFYRRELEATPLIIARP